MVPDLLDCNYTWANQQLIDQLTYYVYKINMNTIIVCGYTSSSDVVNTKCAYCGLVTVKCLHENMNFDLSVTPFTHRNALKYY